MKARRFLAVRDRNRIVAIASLALIAAGLLVDLATPPALVVAILFDIPIALSALSTSRRLPVWITLAALAASVVAGYGNALENGVDRVSLLNRALAAVSFVLIGILTIALRRAAAGEVKLRMRARRSEQEVRLREMLARLSDPMPFEQFLQRTAVELRELLAADAVVLASHDGKRFTAPRAAAPASSGFASIGQSLPWPVTATGETSSQVVAARLVTDLLLVGRLQPKERGNMTVLVRRPHVEEGQMILAAALRFLDPLLDRCSLLERAY
ncbi:MAG TPA: hypothetical protein VF168_01150 [Trueperaceae bacterium]